VFSYLNIEFPLSDLSAKDLKNLINAANVTENFPYTGEELLAAYEAAPDYDGEEVEITETTTAETVTSDTSDIIQTAEPIETEETTTTTPPHVIEPPAATTTAPASSNNTSSQTTTSSSSAAVTTAPPTTSSSAAAVTKPESSVTSSASSNSDKVLTVVINIDGDETIQEVAYGGSAEKPADPVVEGKKFTGWDKSFDNITEDTVISAIFEDSSAVYHTVTISIADKTTAIQVKDGEAAPLPSTLNIEGYVFKGWDTDFSKVTSDITVTAILEKESNSVTVTFMISGLSYSQVIEKGGTAIPPFTPDKDINGNEFTGWDKSLTNITDATVITAQFGKSEYTVTFVIDGTEYPVTVKAGADAVPPYTPTYDSRGRSFIGWDGSYYAVSKDITITAIFI
jgi:hypothetical protein